MDKKKIFAILRVLRVVFVVAFIVSAIFNVVLATQLEESKQTYNYKIDKIKTVQLDLQYADGSPIRVYSYAIRLTNQSHDYTMYSIANEVSEDAQPYLTKRTFVYNNTHDHYIDYNIGKVELHINLYVYGDSDDAHWHRETYVTCYTKGENNKIGFYKDFECTEPADFNIPAFGTLPAINVNLDVTTTYMDR